MIPIMATLCWLSRYFILSFWISNTPCTRLTFCCSSMICSEGNACMSPSDKKPALNRFCTWISSPIADLTTFSRMGDGEPLIDPWDVILKPLSPG